METIKGKILVEHDWPIPALPRYAVFELNDGFDGRPYWGLEGVYNDHAKAAEQARSTVIPDGIAYRAVVVEIQPDERGS